MPNEQAYCDNCGCSFTKRHPSQRFHSKKCKDRFWNKLRHQDRIADLDVENYDPGDDEYWNGKDF